MLDFSEKAHDVAASCTILNYGAELISQLQKCLCFNLVCARVKKKKANYCLSALAKLKAEEVQELMPACKGGYDLQPAEVPGHRDPSLAMQL